MRNLLLLLLLSFLIYACSASSAKEEGEADVYVFDDVTTINTPKVEEPIQEVVKENEIQYDYIVQLGAFTTKDRADKFVSENRDKCKYPMMIIFDSALNYHLVQLPVFQEREEADRVLRDLMVSDVFKDAFVKPVPEMN